MNKRILIVDDDQNLRSMLQAILEEEAYEVDTANDGLRAWEKLGHQQKSYETILLDLNMPHMDGLQLIQVLQNQGGRFLPSIIALSADQDAIHQASEMGIFRALAKPFDLEMLLGLLAEERRALCYTAA